MNQHYTFRKVILFYFFSFLTITAFSQVGIGTTNPNTNALLEIDASTTPGGLLLPRVALVATNNVAPLSAHLAGMAVYNTATTTGTNGVSPGYYFNDGSRWVRIAATSDASDDWKLTGNAGTVPGTNFIGTTDNQPFRVRTDNQERFEFTNNGRLRSFHYGGPGQPTYSWVDRSNTGMWSQADNVISFSTNGTEKFRIPNAEQVHAMGNGTAAAPFYSWSSDSDIGMYRIGANTLGLSTNGNERMRIISGGNVGVNTGNSLWTDVSLTAFALNNNDDGVAGSATNGIGVYGQSIDYVGVQGTVVSSSSLAGVVGSNASDSYGDGVWGLTRLGQDGVYGEKSSGLGNGVFGNSTNIGVRGVGGNGGIFESGLNNGFGLIAWNTTLFGANRNGLLAIGQNLGYTLNFPGTGAVLVGRSSGGSGWADNNDGTGLIGVGNKLNTASISVNGAGVAGTGASVGVYGKANAGANPIGVIGVGNNIGTYTIPSGNQGAGVAGTGLNIGVFGHATDENGYGVYSSGDFHATGTITSDQPIVVPRGIISDGFIIEDGHVMVANTINSQTISASGNLTAGGTKNFIIDDPRDPANKYLKHASIESNEILNLYRGVNAFDSSGEVVVQLPDYYDAINKNASYQLTSIGAAMPNIHIAKEVKNGVFVIAGGVPGKKVSWVVTAERNDPYIRNNPENRIMVVDKGSERGLYLTPEVYGQSADKGILRNKISGIQNKTNSHLSRNSVGTAEMQSQTLDATKINREEVLNQTMPLREVKNPESIKRINNQYKPQGSTENNVSKNENPSLSEIGNSKTSSIEQQPSATPVNTSVKDKGNIQKAD
ncbi:hypothetical protein H4O20_06335 [Aequorivita sp. 609]|uniref:hypothetical protein n=1 Tax=Aequorivita TaxID=153265 RepID=UPI0016139F2D|nr:MULTISPECIES: hypothetical protein [Aequorivita]MBB6681056.1 hypothetical protein [Aequorivita sp. 609]